MTYCDPEWILVTFWLPAHTNTQLISVNFTCDSLANQFIRLLIMFSFTFIHHSSILIDPLWWLINQQRTQFTWLLHASCSYTEAGNKMINSGLTCQHINIIRTKVPKAGVSCIPNKCFYSSNTDTLFYFDPPLTFTDPSALNWFFSFCFLLPTFSSLLPPPRCLPSPSFSPICCLCHPLSLRLSPKHRDKFLRASQILATSLTLTKRDRIVMFALRPC